MTATKQFVILAAIACLLGGFVCGCAGPRAGSKKPQKYVEEFFKGSGHYMLFMKPIKAATKGASSSASADFTFDYEQNKPLKPAAMLWTVVAPFKIDSLLRPTFYAGNADTIIARYKTVFIEKDKSQFVHRYKFTIAPGTFLKWLDAPTFRFVAKVEGRDETLNLRLKPRWRKACEAAKSKMAAYDL